jgi:cytidylate kinase
MGTWNPDVLAGDPSPRYRAMIQEVITQTATEGQAVIVAHGAGILLRERPEVLRVFLTGSCAVRAGRVAAERGIDEHEARRVVAHADRERRAYLQRFFGLEQETPAHYDLVVNTDHLTTEAAARIVLAAACPGAAPVPAPDAMRSPATG